MAYSQLEFASIRSSFGCILRDRNQRNNSDDVVYQKSLKVEVKPAPSTITDENSQNRADSWIGKKPKKSNKTRLGSPEKPRTRKNNNFSDSSERNEISGGASSLVQIWEARLNRSNGGNSPIRTHSTENSSEMSVKETDLLAPFIDGESEPETKSKSPDLTVEIESGTLKSVSDSGESKWGRVGEQKLTAAADNVGAVDTLKRVESRFPVITCSPRLRGRQALFDLLVHRERERHRELDTLLERNAVSRFPQRGRLQSMLRLRSFKRGLVIQDRHRSTLKGDLNPFKPGSTFLRLREKLGENAANVNTEAERRKGQQSETSSTERLSPQNRNKEEAILRKKETESEMSCLMLKEPTLAEVLKRKSDNTSPITSVTHREPQILDKEEPNKVGRGPQATQETTFLVMQESSFQNGWEEQEEYEDEQSYYGDVSYDWITEISRPRTYWEDLRKTRYLEVMNTRSDKDDICRLLERRTVSGFLQSGLREKIDKLIMGRVQTHPVPQIEEVGKEEERRDICEEEEICDIGEEKAEDRDNLSQSLSQIFAPSPFGSWSTQDTGVTSTPLHNLHSTEMEIISDLRSQILQLQLEMSELRDSVKTCLDVNASLQKSVHRDNPLKRKCCVCNETQIETLLYRCGHMCTCLRCANELQCNGGKCPICCAKIVDVVRVFVDSRT